MTLAVAFPRCTASDTASANAPIGASSSTQRTIASIASAIARKNATAGARYAGSSFASASPNNAAKTMSGSIAPSLAVAMTFDGTRPTIQLANVGGVVVGATPADARRAAAAAGSTCINP